MILGLDTSNYTSSVALCDEEGRIIADNRQLLKVKEGEKGLRQSDALFQHWNNLPVLLEPVLKEYSSEITAICVSTRPRPVDGSYMPVFTAGINTAKTLGAALGVPVNETSHQEGHLMAAAHGSEIDFRRPVLGAHLSGGTLELVLVKDEAVSVVGATKDISFGQLLDRIGVEMGFPFPAGRYIDELACSIGPERPQNPFSRIFTDETGANLSGLETQLKSAVNKYTPQLISYFAMERISQCFVKLTESAKERCGAEQVLVSGGVASSKFLRNYCSTYGYVFGEAKLCSDNAVGVALLKGRKLWQ